MKGDFTRRTFDPARHYSGVLQQQGRVQLDADWNEQGAIWKHNIRTEAIDVIGQSGAPKHTAAFAITPGTGGDFMLSAGRYYVDGILCENDAAMHYASQDDLPGAGALTAAGRYFVYLDVWERLITALDDPHIREVALGGPDTAVRSRVTWQVKTVLVGAADDCSTSPAAWTAVITASTGKLSARAKPNAKASTPCILPPGGGYRRLENQLYRVEMHTAGSIGSGTAPTFKWSRDNGSVTASIASISSNQITLVAARIDAATGFAPDQWIEILDDRNDLLGVGGTLARITAVNGLVLTIDTSSEIPTTLTPSTPDLKKHAKVRRWDSAGTVTAAIPSSNDGFIALEDGVEVRFENGTYACGDFWTIPARTETANVEWPVDASNVPVPELAAGIQHHYAKIGVIDCAAGTLAVSLVDDCRNLFPPLTETGGGSCCCSLTVGQGGDYATITDALAALPDGGGEICVEAGSYTENVLIADKMNVTIRGCNTRTEITSNPPAAGATSALPVFTIARSSNIRIECMSIVADRQGVGILVDDTVQAAPAPAADIAIEINRDFIKRRASSNLTFTRLVMLAAMRSAIEVHEAQFVMITDNEIEMRGTGGAAPAVFFTGVLALIAHNMIVGAGFASPYLSGFRNADTTSTAGGASGIQIGGGAERVQIIGNLIQRVSGQGITLGSVNEVDGNGNIIIIVGWPGNPNDPCNPCRPPVRIQWKIIDLNGNTVTRTSAGDLYEIEIVENHIRGTGLDGIGVAAFFDLSQADEFISVHGLTILDNDIRECLRRPQAPIDLSMADSMGYGGIALSDVDTLTIHRNVIQDNGVLQLTPTCGIFVLHGEGIDIGDNHILNNGQPVIQKDSAARIGRRGGIMIVYAIAPYAASIAQAIWGGLQMESKLNVDSKSFGAKLPKPAGYPAASIHNNIVEAPQGQALAMMAVGPVSVTANQFSTNSIVPGIPQTILVGSTVTIWNLGVSNELYGQIVLFKLAQNNPTAGPGLDDVGLGKYLANGNILFADNQIALNLIDRQLDLAASSITLLSTDDIGYHNNQSDCNLWFGMDGVLTNAAIFGGSVRVSDNRFKEGMWNALISAWTLGVMNTTVQNQSTHCIIAQGAPSLLVKLANLALSEAMFGVKCGDRLGFAAKTFIDKRAMFQ